MNQRVILHVTVKLLSDAIFGSGHSIPGGEDIGVCTDSCGYPYLKGSTFKGLLRESTGNLLAWEGGAPNRMESLFGAEDRSGADDCGRLRVTSLVLEAAPSNPADCFDVRAFTALENGVASKGSLRMAACVRCGLQFVGQIICEEEDSPLIQNALLGIHRLGSLRNRGFGHVQISFRKEPLPEATQTPATQCSCLYYKLDLKLPVQITNLERSFDNSYETRPCISGAAVRGMVVNCLAKRDPEWFAENRIKLLSDQTRFLDAFPAAGKECGKEPATIPSPMGFYEDAGESTMESILIDGSYTGIKKRAKIGTFCTLKGDTIHYWKPETDSAMRIKRSMNAEKKQVFQTQYLSAGQTFEGYILLDDPTLAPKIAQCLQGDVWLGADRYSGFGLCHADTQATEQPAWVKEYGIQTQEAVGTTLYMLLLSPAAALGKTGCPKAMDDAFFSELLGTETHIVHSATAVSEYRAYNRTWQCQSPLVRMYERGSMFKLECRSEPSLHRLEALQSSGVGIRRSEGFGQVLFLSKARFETLTKKQKRKSDKSQDVLPAHVILRRAQMRWVQEQSKDFARHSISKNRIGEVQAQCEKAIANGGDTQSLRLFITKYTDNGNPAIVANYKTVLALVDRILDCNVQLPVKEPHDICERLQLICMLLDYHRKGGKD